MAAQATTEPETRDGFHDKAVKGLSVAVIALGCVCFGLGITTVAIAATATCFYRGFSNDYQFEYDSGTTTITTTPGMWTGVCFYELTWVCPGIWCGLMFFVSGVIGKLAASRKTTSLIVSMMVLSILTVCVALTGATFNCLANFDRNWDNLNPYPASLISLNFITASSSVLCSILSFIIFGYACRAVCCNGSCGYPAGMHQPLRTPMLYAPMPHPMLVQGGIPATQPFATPPGVPVFQQNVATVQHPMFVRGSVPAAQPMVAPQGMPVFQQNAGQLIYMLHGNQVIGIPSWSMQPMPGLPASAVSNAAAPEAPPYTPASTAPAINPDV